MPESAGPGQQDQPRDTAASAARRTCMTCWFNETPKHPVDGCPCCENDHGGGHYDLDGNPQ